MEKMLFMKWGKIHFFSYQEKEKGENEREKGGEKEGKRKREGITKKAQ